MFVRSNRYLPISFRCYYFFYRAVYKHTNILCALCSLFRCLLISVVAFTAAIITIIEASLIKTSSSPLISSALLSVRFISHRRTISRSPGTTRLLRPLFRLFFFVFLLVVESARAFQWATTEAMTDRWLLSAPAIKHKQSPDWFIPRSFPDFLIWKCFGFCLTQYW